MWCAHRRHGSHFLRSYRAMRRLCTKHVLIAQCYATPQVVVMTSDTLLAPKHLAIVPGATHGFEEPGALQDVVQLAAQWFRRYLDIEGL